MKRLLAILPFVLLAALPLGAQEKEKPAAPRPVPPSPPPLVNVQIELSILDDVGPAEPQRKTVTMLLADGHMGRVRSQRGSAAVLNVDATPRLQKDGRVLLQVVVEYRPPEKMETAGAMSPINEMLTVLLPSGKPLVITQAADPSSDRKVTVEATATVLK